MRIPGIIINLYLLVNLFFFSVSIVSTNVPNQIEACTVNKRIVKNLVPINLSTSFCVSCMHDNKWWLEVVLEYCFEKGDFRMPFMHPYSLCQNFYWPKKPDTFWILYRDFLDNINVFISNSHMTHIFNTKCYCEKIQKLTHAAI